MNRRISRPLTVVVCAALFAAIGLAAQAREFRSANGVIKIEAEVAAFDGKTVRLVMPVGARNVPISSLSAADQDYLKKTYPDGLKPELITAGNARGKGKAMQAGESDKAGASGDKPSFKVELIGVTVSKPIPNLPAEVSPVPTGTHVLLLVSSPISQVSGLDVAKSKLSTFEDNKGTDLTEGSTGEVFEFIPLPDGKSALVHIHQSNTPAAKSVRATLKGVLHLASGKEDQTTAVPLNLEVLIGL